MRSHSIRPIFYLLAALLLCSDSQILGEEFNILLEEISFVYDGRENSEIDLVINAGDTVRWTWATGFHNVVVTDGNSDNVFHDHGHNEHSDQTHDDDSPVFISSGDPTNVAGTAFDVTFDKPGVYFYHCHPHESVGMISSITVVPEPRFSPQALIGCVYFVTVATWRRRVRLLGSATRSN